MALVPVNQNKGSPNLFTDSEISSIQKNDVALVPKL
jgi:hypothetical protein